MSKPVALGRPGRSTVLDPASAADLVHRIVAGQDGAEAELVERAGPTLRFLCRRYTRTEAEAEDVYQETLMLALEKIRAGEVQEPERLAGFLRAVAKNLSTQEYRRRRYTAEVSSEALPKEPDDPRADPLASLLTSERNRTVRRLLGDLEVRRDREILLRYYLGEESSSRICNDLELEPAHFYRVLHRARKRYLQLWKEHLSVARSSPGSLGEAP